ncbi:MAG: hypothetical protein QOE45_586 [Frankiaceae bacterium]|nr:hypothetical protein [Frankiaceae bacterium]
MIYALRVVVPDRPGSLGALASAIGRAGGDILNLDVVERGPHGAVDDLLVDLPPPALADGLVGAVTGVDGVTLEGFRPYLGDRDVIRDLDLVDALAAEPQNAYGTLTHLAPQAFRSAWALLVEASPGHPATIRERSDAAPDTVVMGLPWLPLPSARRLAEDAEWVPAAWRALGTELMAAPAGRPALALLVGRTGGPAYRAGEVARLAHLASIAGTVVFMHAARVRNAG